MNTDTKYRITNITHLNGETRTDDRYPLRIGSVVDFYNLEINQPMILEYYERNNKPYSGYLRTSWVKEYIEAKGKVVVTTENSVYYLELI